MTDLIDAGSSAEPPVTDSAQPDPEKKDEPKSAKDWLEEIKQAETDMKPFHERCKKLQELYARQKKDSEVSADRKFALLWSNIETLKPAVLAKGPKPAVNRRFSDRDQVARYVGDVLQRSLSTIYELQDMTACVKLVRDDFLLCSRGTAWVRYVPSFTPQTFGQETIDVLSDETLGFDFVHWSDYVQPMCRMWKDLPWVGRRVFLDDDRFKKRFGEELFTKLKQSGKGAGSRKKDGIAKSDKATICTYEIWSKRDGLVIWLARDCDFVLDEQPPLYNLHDFWPCPKPAFGTVASDSLVPVADYVYYQDQAEEIDDLTKRIGALSDALKLVGFYPAAAEGEVSSAIELALNPSTGNKLIPVPGWAAFVQGGGAKDLVQWLPIENVVKVLQGCIELRKQLVEDVYQITGISDILRGSTEASETATAQSIKAQWGSIRIRDRQAELARFCCDMTRIAAEIVAEKFQPETLWRLSGLTFPTAQEKQMLQQRIAMEQAVASQPAPMQGGVPAGGAGVTAPAPQSMQGPTQEPQPGDGAGAGFPPAPQPAPAPAPQMMGSMGQGAQLPSMQPPPPLTDAERKLADMPTQEEIVALLHNDGLRSYRIEIETDSTIEPDEQAEKEARNEFLEVLAGFLERAGTIAAQAPMLIPMLGEALMFTVRGYRAGHQLEDVVQQAVDQMVEQSKVMAAQPTPVDPAVQIDQERFASEKQDKEARLSIDQQSAQTENDIKKQKADFEIQSATDGAARAHQLAVAKHNKQLMEAGQTDDGMEQVEDPMGGVVTSQQSLQQGMGALMQAMAAMAASIANLTAVASAPKTSHIIRGADGFVGQVITTPNIPQANAPTTEAVQ